MDDDEGVSLATARIVRRLNRTSAAVVLASMAVGIALTFLVFEPFWNSNNSGPNSDAVILLLPTTFAMILGRFLYLAAASPLARRWARDEARSTGVEERTIWEPLSYVVEATPYRQGARAVVKWIALSVIGLVIFFSVLFELLRWMK